MVIAKFQMTVTVLAGSLLMTGAIAPVAVAADAPEVVRFGWFGGPRPWVIGKAKGMFEEALGTKIEWVQFPSGAAALNSIAAEEVDISRLGSTPTVAAIARGLPIEMIAISGIIATSERLIAKEGIDNVADLKGKSAAFPPGSTAHYALMAALKVNDVPASEVTLLSLTPTEMVAAYSAATSTPATSGAPSLNGWRRPAAMRSWPPRTCRATATTCGTTTSCATNSPRNIRTRW